ncbi:hypothetical protein KW782_01905 [Candidatus Parcubacteria bacterium]|nr:hypothetical protein [Candidatus Parcubacteria bacterium]
MDKLDTLKRDRRNSRIASGLAWVLSWIPVAGILFSGIFWIYQAYLGIKRYLHLLKDWKVIVLTAIATILSWIWPLSFIPWQFISSELIFRSEKKRQMKIQGKETAEAASQEEEQRIQRALWMRQMREQEQQEEEEYAEEESEYRQAA